MSEFKPFLLTLPSLTPSLALEILPHGLTIHRIFVQHDGKTHDIVVGPENPADHLKNKYTNTIIGRYTNRLPTGKYSAERDGIKSEVTIIPNENDYVSLHGGPKGFDSMIWTHLDSFSQSTLFTKSELDTIVTEIPGETSKSMWRLVSENGDQGFPGKLTVEVLIGLKESPKQTAKETELKLGSIVVVYRAKVEGENGDMVVTPINLTQHWGFNLDASLKDGPESLTTKHHNLLMKASHTVVLDQLDLPTGHLKPTGGPHVHDGKKIGDGFPQPGGYNHFYVFPNPDPTPKRFALSELGGSLDFVKPVMALSGTKSVVELSSQKSGLKVNFFTNQSGVQYYSDNFSDPSRTSRKKIHGGSGNVGDGYTPQSAAFLEFHEPTAAFLHPYIQSNGDDTLLISDSVYNHFVKVDVSVIYSHTA